MINGKFNKMPPLGTANPNGLPFWARSGSGNPIHSPWVGKSVMSISFYPCRIGACLSSSAFYFPVCEERTIDVKRDNNNPPSQGIVSLWIKLDRETKLLKSSNSTMWTLLIDNKLYSHRSTPVGKDRRSISGPPKHWPGINSSESRTMH